MKKTFLIFAMGAMGLTIVNAQQQQMPRSQDHMEITHQLSDGVQLADLPDALKEELDDMVKDGDAQLVNIERAGDGYELTFRKEDRLWRQRFSSDGKSEGGERKMEREERPGQTHMGTQGGQTMGQTQTQQRAQDARTQAGQRAQDTRTQAGQQAQDAHRTAMDGATRIQNRDLPRNIRNTIDGNREDRDAQIMSIERGTRDGQDNYDVTFQRDDRTYTRTYGTDGREIQMGGDQGTRGGQTRTGGGTTGGQTQTGGTTGGQTQTGGTRGGQTQTGGTTGGQTRTGGGTTGGQTQTGGTTGGQTRTGGTTGGQTQTGGTTGGQTQTGQMGDRIPLEGARRMETRDMPRNIQNTIQQSDEDRDAEITSIQRGTRDGQDNYDVTFRRDNRTWTRSYDGQGRLIPERRDNR